jgi:epoxyqueuosine reductase
MDWWFGQADPPGNRVLAKTIRQLCGWIKEQFDINVVHLPYRIEKGGAYVKDAAVLAALGCIGKNNIVVTPEFGPRVRLRALTLDIELPSTGPLPFDPCALCDEPCKRSCPQNAFAKKQHHADDYGQKTLPGRDGFYSKPACSEQMMIDKGIAKKQVVEGFDNPIAVIKYCRRCELSCPVGKPTYV